MSAPRWTQILVVDDSKVNVKIARRILEREGATTLCAYDGREALDMLAVTLPYPDAVLMDVQMPEMDGIEATRAIRDGRLLQHLPVIGLSAAVSAADSALEAGMNHFLVKPLDPNELLIVLRSMIYTKGHRRPPPLREKSAQAREDGQRESAALPMTPGAERQMAIRGIDQERVRKRLGSLAKDVPKSVDRLLTTFRRFLTVMPIPETTAELNTLNATLGSLALTARMICADDVEIAARRAANCMSMKRLDALPQALLQLAFALNALKVASEQAAGDAALAPPAGETLRALPD